MHVSTRRLAPHTVRRSARVFRFSTRHPRHRIHRPPRECGRPAARLRGYGRVPAVTVGSESAQRHVGRTVAMTGWIATGAEAGMRSAVTCMSNRRCPSSWALFVLAAAAPVALAQSANCEAFKERLAAGIEGNGVRGYALEVVPSGSPVPLGARSLGTCDGGAYTVLYWRWAQARGEAEPAAPPTSVTDAPAATPRPTQAPKGDAEPRSRREPKAMS